MKDLCIQIQPQLAPDLDVAAVTHRCESLARNKDLIERFAVVEGIDIVPYVNLMFETRSIVSLWESLNEQLFSDEILGPSLLRASMAMCEGDRGWDDYLQLHHFDPTVKLDEPEDG